MPERKKQNKRKLRIMGFKESIKDVGTRFNRLKKGPIGRSVSKAGEGIKKADKWAKTRTFTGETSLFSRKQFSGGKKKTTKSKASTAASRIQKKLIEAGHTQKSLDEKAARHASWKKARKEGKLKEWEAKNKPKKKRRIGVDPNKY